MNEWMNEWKKERMNAWMDGWMNEWMILWMSECMNECMAHTYPCQSILGVSAVPLTATVSMPFWGTPLRPAQVRVSAGNPRVMSKALSLVGSTLPHMQRWTPAYSTANLKLCTATVNVCWAIQCHGLRSQPLQSSLNNAQQQHIPHKGAKDRWRSHVTLLIQSHQAVASTVDKATCSATKHVYVSATDATAAKHRRLWQNPKKTKIYAVRGIVKRASGRSGRPGGNDDIVTHVFWAHIIPMCKTKTKKRRYQCVPLRPWPVPKRMSKRWVCMGPSGYISTAIVEVQACRLDLDRELHSNTWTDHSCTPLLFLGCPPTGSPHTYLLAYTVFWFHISFVSDHVDSTEDCASMLNALVDQVRCCASELLSGWLRI